jgi:hypothetical protein
MEPSFEKSSGLEGIINPIIKKRFDNFVFNGKFDRQFEIF